MRVRLGRPRVWRFHTNAWRKTTPRVPRRWSHTQNQQLAGLDWRYLWVVTRKSCRFLLTKRSSLRDPRLVYWIIGYTEFVAKTVAFVLFDAYDNFCIWRLSRRMSEFMQKLSLKSVLGSDRNVEEFTHILSLIAEINFRQVPQHWGSRSKRRSYENKLE